MIELITLFPLQSWLAAPSTALHLQSPHHSAWGDTGSILLSPKGLGVLCLQCGAFWGSSFQGISDQPEQGTPCFVLVPWVCLCSGDEGGAGDHQECTVDGGTGSTHLARGHHSLAEGLPGLPAVAGAQGVGTEEVRSPSAILGASGAPWFMGHV